MNPSSTVNKVGSQYLPVKNTLLESHQGNLQRRNNVIKRQIKEIKKKLSEFPEAAALLDSCPKEEDAS